MNRQAGYGSLADGGAIEPTRVQGTSEEACLSFHNVSYVVEKKLIRKQRKVVLNDVRCFSAQQFSYAMLKVTFLRLAESFQLG